MAGYEEASKLAKSVTAEGTLRAWTDERMRVLDLTSLRQMNFSSAFGPTGTLN